MGFYDNLFEDEMMEGNTNSNLSNFIAIKDAIKNNDRDIFNDLVKDVNVNYNDGKGFTLLALAIRLGNKMMVKSLIDNGADINQSFSKDGESRLEDTPLTLALSTIAKGSSSKVVDIAEYLIKKGADVNHVLAVHDLTPLHIISIGDPDININGKIKLIKLMVKKGADLDAIDDYYKDETPLHTALAYNNFKIAETLIKLGADTDIEDSNGNTALSILKKKSVKNRNAKKLLQLI